MAKKKAHSLNKSVHRTVRLSHEVDEKIAGLGPSFAAGIRILLASWENHTPPDTITTADLDKITRLIVAILDNIRDGQPYDHERMRVVRMHFDHILQIRHRLRGDTK